LIGFLKQIKYGSIYNQEIKFSFPPINSGAVYIHKQNNMNKETKYDIIEFTRALLGVIILTGIGIYNMSNGRVAYS
jgi:hypothetical protein